MPNMTLYYHVKLISPEGVVINDHICKTEEEAQTFIDVLVLQKENYKGGCWIQHNEITEIDI